MIREDQLIERIRSQMAFRASRVLRVGIGDDAAVVRPSPGKEWVITCDQFIEGVHFLGDRHPAEVVGYKALARATSDLAAMGATPTLSCSVLALPARRTGSWFSRMLRGMAKAARHFGLKLAGGDTARMASSDGVVLNLAVFGEAKAGHAVLRSGARPGDSIFVAGRLGAAQLGLEVVLQGLHKQRRWQPLLGPHYYPRIHLDLGQWLAQRKLASAMMDLSDGLSTDLHRLCLASNVGAHLSEESLPCVAVPHQLRRKGVDPLTLALHGGEDYGLLFTVPKRSDGRIPRSFRGTPLTRIGEIVGGQGMKLTARDGRDLMVAPQGWDHFRQSHTKKKRG